MKPLLLLLSTLLLISCDPEPISEGFIPMEDVENNFCVVSHRDESGCYDEDDGWSVNQLLSAIDRNIKTIRDGSDGFYNEIIDHDYKVGGNICANYGGDYATYGQSSYWISYKCQAIAVDVKLYGPYLNSEIEQKIIELESELVSEGYTIGYIEKEVASNSLTYAIFYVYKENTANKAQAEVASGLELLKMKSALTGNKYGSLLNEVQKSKSMTFTKEQERAVNKAAAFLKTIKKLKRL